MAGNKVRETSKGHDMKSFIYHVKKPKLYPFGKGELLKDFRQSSDLDKFFERDAHTICYNPVSGT